MKATYTRIPTADRLHAKLAPGPNGCLEFTGSRLPKGYGTIGDWRDGGWKNVLTHRVAWELAYGPIPEGMCVCHHCDNPPCCNPEHLFLGTNTDNMRDASRKGRVWQQKKTHCPHGHDYNAENTHVDIGSGARVCLTCRRANARRYYEAKKDAILLARRVRRQADRSA